MRRLAAILSEWHGECECSWQFNENGPDLARCPCREGDNQGPRPKKEVSTKKRSVPPVRELSASESRAFLRFTNQSFPSVTEPFKETEP